MDNTIEQLRGMVSFVRSARNGESYTREERHGFLTFALMHACQAAIFGDGQPHRYGFTIHDYKHVLIKAIDRIMNGDPIDLVMTDVSEYPLAASIDWNYSSKKDVSANDTHP